MKELDYKNAPDVGGGIVPLPDGCSPPDIGYPQWPLAPDPYPDVDHSPYPADPEVR